MKNILLLAIAFLAAGMTMAQEKTRSNEAIIRAYFGGWEKKDWKQVAAQLADDFTFTTPAPDDHINTKQFYDKCWPQAPHIERFEYVRILDKGAEESMALMQVYTTEGKVLRNIEYFHFENGRIKSIEVFFGGSGAGFPTNAK